MKFYYDLRSTKDFGEYYDERSIRNIRVYPATPAIEKAAEDVHSTLWPVHDPSGPSYEPVECKDINDAYAYLLMSENQSAFEYNHNI